MKRWIVRSGEGPTVADILRRMREGDEAITEGRVFVGKKRVVRADHPVRAGDELELGPPPAVSVAATILFDKDGIVACVKPAGIPTVPDHAGSAHALVASVATALGCRASDLRVTSRLDREVSGVVLFARDAAAEARLREARVAGRYVRRYVAVALGESTHASGRWSGAIGAGVDPRHRAVGGADAKESLTLFRVVGVASGGDVHASLLALAPITGRTHQLRVHAAQAAMPLFGDRDYGGAARITLAGGRVVALDRIALHCARVAIDSDLLAEAPIPEALAVAWTALGGAAEAWEKAVSCDL